MINTSEKISNLFKHVKEYVALQITLYKLETAEHISKIISNAIAFCFVGIIFLIGMIFWSIALGFFLASLLKSTCWGFFIVGLIYLLISLFVWKMKTKILRLPLMNWMLNQFFKNNKTKSNL